MTTFYQQTILLYDGRYVPLRDIQRLRLCGTASSIIRTSMDSLSRHGGRVGCYMDLPSGVGVFYKCPPEMVDVGLLQQYGVAWDVYQMKYYTAPVPNATNKHNDQYWERIASSSPYLTSPPYLSLTG